MKTIATTRIDCTGMPGMVFLNSKGDTLSFPVSAEGMALIFEQSDGPGRTLGEVIQQTVTFLGDPIEEGLEFDAAEIRAEFQKLILENARYRMAEFNKAYREVQESLKPPSAWKIAALALGGTFLVSLATVGAARLTSRK